MNSRITDVAKLAGVSMKTVSRVLNNEPNVREQTRASVLNAVRSLNYKPNSFARSLAGSRNFQIAFIFDNPSPNYLIETMSGALDACESSDYTLIMHPVNISDALFDERMIAWLKQVRPDGLILSPPLTDDESLIKQLLALEIPFACISPRGNAASISVRINEQQAASELVQHLVALGHSRIAHIKGHRSHGASHWRYQGYKDGLKRANIKYEKSHVVEGQFSFESGVKAAHALFGLKPRPTAIFAANDDMASGVVYAARSVGIAIPDDLSVCGFDDNPIAQQIHPSLTTVRQPSRDMAKVLTQQLIQFLAGQPVTALVLMPYTLHIRQSTGVLKAKTPSRR
jgi:LacI family transcriptional regulator